MRYRNWPAICAPDFTQPNHITFMHTAKQRTRAKNQLTRRPRKTIALSPQCSAFTVSPNTHFAHNIAAVVVIVVVVVVVVVESTDDDSDVELLAIAKRETDDPFTDDAYTQTALEPDIEY